MVSGSMCVELRWCAVFPRDARSLSLRMGGRGSRVLEDKSLPQGGMSVVMIVVVRWGLTIDGRADDQRSDWGLQWRRKRSRKRRKEAASVVNAARTPAHGWHQRGEIRATQLSLAPSLDPSLPGPSKGPDWLHCDSRLKSSYAPPTARSLKPRIFI